MEEVRRLVNSADLRTALASSPQRGNREKGDVSPVVELRGVTVRGLTAAEYPQLLALLPRVMGAPREYFAAMYRNDPAAKPEHSRVVLLNGEIVSHIRLYDRWQYVGGVPVHVGCVGDVCTVPEHRLKGYCRTLLEDAMGYWEEQEYDLSMVVSGVEVYQRCGWVTYPETRYTVPARDAPPEDGPYQVRRFVRADELKEARLVYEEYHAHRSLATVRSEEYWERHFYWIAGEREDAFFVAERKGQVMAYIRHEHRGDELLISEFCYARGEEEAVPGLLAASLRFAYRRGYLAVTATLPDDHPAVPLLQREPECQVEQTHVLLFRLVNLRRLLGRLTRLFADRLRAASLPAGTLTLGCEGQAVTLDWDEERVVLRDPQKRPLTLSPADFFRLLFGQASGRELRLTNRYAFLSTQVALLEALFPKGHPIYWRTDVV